MGEKEIKPADPKPQDQGTPPPYGGTQEKPGTGNPNAKPEQPTNQGGGNKGSDSGGGGGWSGSAQYPDGYNMGRDSDGNWTLTHPDGSTGSWDEGSQTWKGSDGKSLGSGWSGGHSPATQTDFGPKR